MLISFKEQVIDNFLIPSFNLSQGETVIIHVPGRPFSQPVSMKIIDGVTGKIPNAGIEIITPLRYAEHIKANLFRHRFFPLTVGSYIHRYSNKHNPVAEKIFAIKWITPSTKIDTLPGTVRRKLSIYAALSWTNNIVFDLSGVDPQGGVEIYSYIKTMVQQGGAAVLVDWSDEFKTDCTTFVEAKYIAAH